MKKINFYFDKISVFLIILLPIGLLISSGVSESVGLLISIIFIITCIYNKNFNWLNNNYFLLLLIICLSLIINLLFSQNLSLSFSRNIFFIKNIIFAFAISHFLKEKNPHYIKWKNALVYWPRASVIQKSLY